MTGNIKTGSASGYRGVWWDGARGKWSTETRIDGQRFYLGVHDTAEGAARAYDAAVWDATGDASRLNFAPPERSPTGQLPPRKPRNVARYRGVGRMGAKFLASITVNGQYHNLGAWRDEREAAIARDRAALFFDRAEHLNVPEESRVLGPLSPKELVTLARFAEKKQHASSQYLGVIYKQKAWAACVVISGRTEFIDRFASEEEAAEARDRVWLHCGFDRALLNFPGKMLSPASLEELRIAQRAAFKETTSSRYRGVCFDQRSGLWEATIGVNYRRRSLGMFTSEIEAAETYDAAALELHDEPKLNFPDRKVKKGGP